MELYGGWSALLYDSHPFRVQGEEEFYIQEAQQLGSPILELGSGTGRLLIPVAKSGSEIHGLDLSEDMLNITRGKIEKLDDATQKRIHLTQGDMRDFKFEQRFKLITIPFRAFLHILTVEDQKKTLQNILEHLAEDGKLILDAFDPKLELINSNLGYQSSRLKQMTELVHPVSGNQVFVWYSTTYNLEDQLINEIWIYEEIEDDGNVIRRQYVPLKVRFVYRYEMQHLLDLCGFKIDALYGNYNREDYFHGGEQIWVCSRA
ncbi:MAG: class I SAM-dependent methyltransferase [Calditrichaeota bacterium]|nr:class I SAM-dependent methyltransferase [Calditrichota bacterium]MBT7787430.1 class I SAM-dependent methyltransferase [Calditrichota bacterium]